MTTIKKLARNAKALSPIFAVLILIAIAVIAGIIVYMFTSGTLATMMGGGTAAQEKVAVQGVEVVDSTTLRVYAQNTGSVNVTITNFIVKDATGNIVDQGTTTPQGGDGILNVDEGLEAFSCTLTQATLQPGRSYTVTLVSSKGGSFVSPSFVA